MRILHSLDDIEAAGWDALAGSQPLLQHAFFTAMHKSGSVCERTGWTPRFLAIEDAGRLVAALPLYEKTHSFGEFVFDWAWAEAWERAGLAYYPKLLTAVPYSPVPGPRLLSTDAASRERLLEAALRHAHDSGLSSWHVLFPTPEEGELLAARGLLLRHGVQFHWCNGGYRDFDDFLDTLVRDKRKKIRQERRRVAEAGITLRRIGGAELGADDWRFVHRCYANTDRERGRVPYLNLEFFKRLGRSLPQSVLVVRAERDGEPIACALDLQDGERLYGRYWGALEYVPGLHFETCYYQGIEHCIERGLKVFEGGAQGEHKLARGFLPETTLSAHWLRRSPLTQAVARFLDRESTAIRHYVDELAEHSPFRDEGVQ